MNVARVRSRQGEIQVGMSFSDREKDAQKVMAIRGPRVDHEAT